MLRDPALKQTYDQQLALEQLQQQVFISQTVSLAEMQLVSGDSVLGEASFLAYPCRCGGSYEMENDALYNNHSVVVQCDTCSLHIRVLQ